MLANMWWIHLLCTNFQMCVETEAILLYILILGLPLMFSQFLFFVFWLDSCKLINKENEGRIYIAMDSGSVEGWKKTSMNWNSLTAQWEFYIYSLILIDYWHICVSEENHKFSTSKTDKSLLDKSVYFLSDTRKASVMDDGYDGYDSCDTWGGYN